MYTKLAYRVFIVFVMVAMLNGMTGCGLDSLISGRDSGATGERTTARSAALDLGFDGSLLLLSLPVADVTIHDLILDQESKVLAVSYSFESIGGALELRQLEITNQFESSSECMVQVSGAGRGPVVGISVIANPSDTDSYTISEWTSTDQLSIQRTRRGERMFENYDFNGAGFSVDFTEAEIERYIREYSRPESRAALGQSSPTESGSLSLKELEFRQFFPAANSLNDNLDGLILVQMLESLEFRSWLEVATGRPGLVNQDKITAEHMCLLAGMGTYKCYVGFWLNPICDAAVGVDIACIIWQVHDWIAN